MNEEFEQVVVNHTHSVEQLKTCFDEFCRTVEKNELFQPGDILEWKPGWKQIQNVDGPFVVLPITGHQHDSHSPSHTGAAGKPRSAGKQKTIPHSRQRILHALPHAAHHPALRAS